MSRYIRLVKLTDCDAINISKDSRKSYLAKIVKHDLQDHYTYAFDGNKWQVEEHDSNNLVAVDNIQVYDFMGDKNGDFCYYLINGTALEQQVFEYNNNYYILLEDQLVYLHKDVLFA